MRTTDTDPWTTGVDSAAVEASSSAKQDNSFEDSFVDSDNAAVAPVDQKDLEKLPDSEQYLARLQSKLKAIQGGTSKRDLINSLSVAREECIARLITDGHNLETQEAEELAANPLIRHIAPHLQALTTTELVHLLKADHLQQVLEEQDTQASEIEDSESKSTDSQSDIQTQDCNGL